MFRLVTIIQKLQSCVIATEIIFGYMFCNFLFQAVMTTAAAETVTEEQDEFGPQLIRKLLVC
jgi:hypothetical protein